MTKPTDTSLRNRTGIKASPIDSREAIEAAEIGTPGPMVNTEAAELTAVRLAYSEAAPPIGTMPPPASVKGAVKTALSRLKGESANVFLDQLAGRLAFERTGTRIYDALLIKQEAAGAHEGGPSREDLLHIREEELEHALLLARCIEELGADPTAVTPEADIQGVAGQGIVQVLGDPRTTLTQALEAVLIAELTDADSWQMLVDLAEGLGQDEMAEQFQLALAQEEDHLANVRAWVSAALLSQAGVEISEEEEEVDEEEEIEAEVADEGDGGMHPPPSGRR
jgi:ferritin-like protein